MQCKSCRAPIEASAQQCQQCGINNPQAISKSKKKVLFVVALTGVLLIVVIPMVASLLWMQN
jgi:predicted nucleic acid-binding Zn ribbon protein